MTGMFTKEAKMRRRVLVVDDELINRRLLGNILSRDYDVFYAENGVQAMDVISENEKTLSLIMLDLLMPEMDGYQVLIELKKSGLLTKIPVIVLTSEKIAEVRSLELGAADFIPKPYDMPEVILARVRHSIELAESYMLLNKTESDALTGLYNRDFFIQYCERLRVYEPDTDMDAVVVNINKFRLINDVYGRPAADTVLKKTSEALDSFSKSLGGLAGRCSADLFYVYIHHTDDLAPLIDELVRQIKGALPDISFSMRIGVYANADKEIDLEQQFDRANLACGKRKNTIETSVEYYDNVLHEKELFDERLIREMDKAIAEKQFKVYFQPKYDVTGSEPRLASAEALIRWIHPELGFISPGNFIPLFEDNGLISKLDRYVWNETAEVISRLKKTYGKSVPISVNVSRVDISDAGLQSTLVDIVERNGLDPKNLLLEITESAYTDNSDGMIEKVSELRKCGFKIEMDDFGTGYSSLNMLSSLPIDALKLDMRFVRYICEREKDLRMVQLVIEIAKYLGVKVIAEGVETEQQYLLLKKSGCDIIQGYYFLRPVPSDVFEKLIKTEV